MSLFTLSTELLTVSLQVEQLVELTHALPRGGTDLMGPTLESYSCDDK
jgi:hypothetical protein